MGEEADSDSFVSFWEHFPVTGWHLQSLIREEISSFIVNLYACLVAIPGRPVFYGRKREGM